MQYFSVKSRLVLTLWLAALGAIALGQDKASANEKKSQSGSQERGISFVEKKKMPQASVFLPAPPEPSDPAFARDSILYVRGKAERGTARLDTALADVRTDVAYYMTRFSGAMHCKLSTQKYPALAELMAGTLNDVRASIASAKAQFARPRPYVHFNEPTPDPVNEAYSPNASYPSGHSVRAWALAILLTSIDPKHGEEIARVGYDICHSRVVLGYHYQSDVEAGMLAASLGMARLMADSLYQQYLERARTEFAEQKKISELQKQKKAPGQKKKKEKKMKK